MEYPQFRKYRNANSWFKILSDKEFQEIKKVGERYERYHIIAEQFPEMNHIRDMLKCEEDRWENIDEAEFNSILNEAGE